MTATNLPYDEVLTGSGTLEPKAAGTDNAYQAATWGIILANMAGSVDFEVLNSAGSYVTLKSYTADSAENIALGTDAKVRITYTGLSGTTVKIMDQDKIRN